MPYMVQDIVQNIVRKDSLDNEKDISNRRRCGFGRNNKKLFKT